MGDIKEIQTKICKCCGEKKPVCEFNKGYKDKNNNYNYRKTCKVCEWLNRHTTVVIKQNWTMEEYKIVLDMLLNNKVQCINNIIPMLSNKSLEDIIVIIKQYLKIGAIKIRVLVNCSACQKNQYVTISQYMNQRNHFCSIRCKSIYQLNTFNAKNGFSYCNKCHKEKPISYFWDNNHGNPRSICKTCMYLRKHQITNTKHWTNIEIHILIDFILNQNETNCFLNPILQKLNDKTIDDITQFIQVNHLEFSAKPLKFKKYCTTCGKGITVNLRKNKDNNFCSIQCAGDYYSKNYFGEKHWLYNRLNLKCDYCGNDIYLTPSRMQNGEKHFCSNKCRNKWFKEIYTKTDEFKIKNKEIMLSNLRTGKISATNTSIQQKVNQMLGELGISYVNEKTIGYYSIDNYLDDLKLIIEVNGDYWHCNPTRYPYIKQLPQYKSIIRDKRKTTYIKKYLNTDILFLWESDINNKPQLCKKLIAKYINNQGLLDNYDSFNYDINERHQLLLKHNKYIPYRQYNKDELKSITKLEVQNKIYQRDKSKWIKYKCECCGKECETLYSHYKKSKHHYCSNTCSNKMKTTSNTILVQCYNCNKEFIINKSKYKNSKSKRFFCNREHWKLYKQSKKD